MPSFTEIASRLYRQLLGLNSAPLGDEHGITTLLEGTVAVATVEAILSEVSASGESFPPEHGSIAWRGEQQRQQLNLFGQPLLQLESESPRAALSNAMGLVMAGKRTSCSLWSSDLAAAQDLLRRAVGHHLPLVVHTINRALPLQGESSEGSHQAIHQLRESGACILFSERAAGNRLYPHCPCCCRTGTAPRGGSNGWRGDRLCHAEGTAPLPPADSAVCRAE